MVADEQGLQEGCIERRFEHFRRPDGQYPGSNQLSSSFQFETGQRLVFGLPEDAELGGYDSSGCVDEDAQHVAAL